MPPRGAVPPVANPPPLWYAAAAASPAMEGSRAEEP